MDEIRVLVVDDETDFLRSVVKRLNLRKIQADGVESGEAAMEYLAGRGVDVVVLDIKMPGRDGLWALDEIRKKYPGVEVIVLTGHTAVEVDADRAWSRRGAFDCLIKPVRIEALIEKIRAAYEKQRGVKA
jgi:DNA-binding NtrC family response regulator